jgi:hypothetical protein
MPEVLYVADRHMPSFGMARLSADVVYAGDSITGATRGRTSSPRRCPGC